jgi:Domain of unknown function (DUF4397)
MWFKKKEALLGSLLLFTIFTLYSCVNEPTIEPIKRPFSTIRVINLSTNVDPMNITIDGRLPSNSLSSVGLASPTGYFDVESGKDTFIVKDNSGNVVFNSTIELLSYERSTVVFAGTYSTNTDINNLSAFQIDEAEVYVKLAPKTDSLSILFIHASNSVDTIEAQKYAITAHITLQGGTSTTDTSYLSYSNPIAFSNVFSIANVAPGSYSFDFLQSSDSTLAVTTPVYDFSTGYRYYIFIYGNPNSLQIKMDEELPPPVRTRY